MILLEMFECSSISFTSLSRFCGRDKEIIISLYVTETYVEFILRQQFKHTVAFIVQTLINKLLSYYELECVN